MKKIMMILKNTPVLIPVLLLGAAGILLGSADQIKQDDQVAPIIKTPSSVGEVAFPHEFHFDDLEIECQTCHHEVTAGALAMPHKDYFDDFWIDCRICHRSDGDSTSQAQSCSNCHHESPTDIADETLSTKVVIHKNCWGCHEVESGEKSSQSCQICHNPNPASIPLP